jgi:hypothetical protein
MIRKTRSVLLELGLLFVRTHANVEGSNGELVLRQRFVIADCDDASSVMHLELDIPFSARKGTPEDKSALAAMTSGLNYAIRDLLMIARGGADEIDQFDDSEYEPKRKTIDSAVAETQKVFGEAPITFDGRIQPTKEEVSILLAIADSPLPPRDAIRTWLDSAAKYTEKQTGFPVKYESLADIPREFAQKILDRYQKQFDAWLKEAKHAV